MILDIIILVLNSFCLLIFAYIYEKNIYEIIIVLSLLLQFMLSFTILDYKLRYKKGYIFIYYLNFIINILTLIVYSYYLTIDHREAVFLVYIIYSISSIFWLISIRREIYTKKVFYKLINTESKEDCVICYEELSIKQVVELRCTHRYHKECIDKWILETPTCPYCRYELV